MNLNRGLARLGAIAALATATAALTLAPATAIAPAPAHGQITTHEGPGCTDIPDAQAPDSGTAGALLPAPGVDTIDPFGPDAAKTSLWKANGFAGLHWHLYDTHGSMLTGCNLGVTNPVLSSQNWLANAMFSTAKAAAALSVMPMHWADKREWLSALDPHLAKITAASRDNVLLVYGPVALAVVALAVMAKAKDGNTAKAINAAGWALAVITVALGVASYPLAASHAYDRALTGMVEAASKTTGQGGDSAADNMTAVFTDKILYPAWLQGQFGSSTSSTARVHGPSIYTAQALSRAEQRALDEAKNIDADTWLEQNKSQCQDPDNEKARSCALDTMAPGSMPTHSAKAKEIRQAKDKLFTETARKVKEGDDASYEHLSGKKSATAGFAAAFGALISVVLLAPFVFVAGLFVIAAFAMLKITIMALPLLACVMLFPFARPYVAAFSKRLVVATLGGPLMTGLAMVYVTWSVICMGLPVPLPVKILIDACGGALLWALVTPAKSFRALVSTTAKEDDDKHFLVNQLNTYMGNKPAPENQASTETYAPQMVPEEANQPATPNYESEESTPAITTGASTQTTENENSGEQNKSAPLKPGEATGPADHHPIWHAVAGTLDSVLIQPTQTEPEKPHRASQTVETYDPKTGQTTTSTWKDEAA